MVGRKDLANLTINLDMNSSALIAKSQQSTRYLCSLGKAGGGLERGFSALQNRFSSVAGALSSLGVPQPLVVFTSLGSAAKSLAPALAPITASVSQLSARLGMSGLGAAASEAAGAVSGFLASSAGLAAVTAPAALLAGFGALTKVLANSTAHLDELAKSSKALQMPSADLRMLRDFGNYQGMRPGAENLMIRMLDRSLIEARYGTQRKVDAFKLLGVDINQTQGKWQQLQDIFAGLSRLAPSVQMRAAMEVFGSRYASQVVMVLNDWAGAVERVQRNRDITPYVDLSAFEEFQDRATDLQIRWESFKDSLKGGLLPVGEVTITAFEGLVSAMGAIKNIIGKGIDLVMLEDATKSAKKMKTALAAAIDPDEVADNSAQLSAILAKIKNPIDDFKSDLNTLWIGIQQGSVTQKQYNEYLRQTVDSFFALTDPVRQYQDGLKKIVDLQRMGALTYEQSTAATTKITEPLVQAGNAIRAMLTPLEQVKKKLEDIADVAKGYEVNGVKIGGLTDAEALKASRNAVTEYINGVASDFDGLMDLYRKNKALFSEAPFDVPFSRLLTASSDVSTPLEKLNRQISNINLAFDDGLMSIDWYSEAMANLVRGFAPVATSLEEVSAKIVNMSKIGEQFSTEDLLSLTASLRPIERISAIMDGFMLGDLGGAKAFSGINTLFGQLQNEVFSLEEALSLGQINPMLFEEKLAPLLEGLKEAQWIAKNIFGSTLDMGSEWHRINREAIDAQAEQMRQYYDSLEEVMQGMRPPAWMMPGAFTSVQWGEGGLGVGHAGVSSAAQIAGVVATAQAVSRRPEEETAKNTKVIAEGVLKLTRREGGLL